MENCVFIKLQKRIIIVVVFLMYKLEEEEISLKILCRKSGVIFMMESRLENNKEGETIKDEWHVFV